MLEHALQQHITTGIIVPNPTATLKTDTDGSAATAYRNSEDCLWPIRCPAGTYVYMAFAGATEATNDPVRIINASSGLELRRNSGTLTSDQYVAATNSVDLRFSSNYVSQATAQSAVGVTTTVTCKATQCSATVPDGDIYGSSGTIKSDSDGTTATVKYSNNENCEWRIHCPVATQSVRIITLAGALAVNDYLRFYDASGNTVMTYTGATISFTATMMPPGLTRISFTSNDAGQSNGFTITWACYTAQCSANYSSFNFNVITAASMSLKSDVDGSTATNLYSNNENCDYVINCPWGYYPYISAIGKTIVDTDTLYLSSGYDVTTSKVYSKVTSSVAYTNYGFVFPNEPLHVRYLTSMTGISNGWTLTYACYKQRCANNQSTAFVVGWNNHNGCSCEGWRVCMGHQVRHRASCVLHRLWFSSKECQFHCVQRHQ